MLWLSHVSSWLGQCAEVWSNVLLGVAVGMVLDEANFEIGGLRVKQIALHSEGGPRLTS